MDHFDSRWRPYYLKAVENKFSPIIADPYLNPSGDNVFYALTLSQALEHDGVLHGVLNHDINLNFQEEYDSILGINNEETHFIITRFDAKLLKHSRVTIRYENESITMAEYSDAQVPLDNEINTSEKRRII